MKPLAHAGARILALRIVLVLCTALLGCDSNDNGEPDSSSDGGDPSGFHARLRGDLVIVDVPPDLDIWQMSCSGWWAVLEKPADEGMNDEWVALRDDRHPGWNNPGYFLDGEYIAPSFNLGCDVVGCAQASFIDEMVVDYAREYVKTGTMAPPEDAEPVSEPFMRDDPADVIESRAFQGRLRVRFTYSMNDACDEPREITLRLDVPADGVCCPIGSESCSSNGPGGGWAPTLDACPEWNGPADVGYVTKMDPHDCPELVHDDTACCGCQADGGI